MSTLDDSKYALDSAPAGFNDKERAKWNKGIEASKKRIAAQCKHLVKGKGVWKRPKRKWSSVAWSQYMNGTAPTLDDIIVGAAPVPGTEDEFSDTISYDDDVVSVEIPTDISDDAL